MMIIVLLRQVYSKRRLDVMSQILVRTNGFAIMMYGDIEISAGQVDRTEDIPRMARNGDLGDAYSGESDQSFRWLRPSVPVHYGQADGGRNHHFLKEVVIFLTSRTLF